MSAHVAAERRPRVLQCITRLGLGGAERVAFGITQALRAEIDFAFFTVHGASADPVGDEMRRTLRENAMPWFTGTRVPMKAGGMIPGGLALNRAIRAFQPDIVHFHSETPEACGAAAVMLADRHRSVALVRTIHNSVFWRYWPRVGRWCDRRLSRAHIACVSEAARTEFDRYRKDSGAPPAPDAPAVIYNGVAVTTRPPHTAPHRADVRRVLFAGRFEEQKGTDVLCRALPHVALPNGTRGEITFMGHGAHQRIIEALAANAPAGWSVTVRGPVAGLEQAFPDYDVVVVPSRFEGLGLVAIEATLCGLPVVITDAPGLREALPADYPWRANPGDAASLATCLGAALAETHRWNAVVTAGQAFAHARFSPAAMADGYRRIYAQARRSAAGA